MKKLAFLLVAIFLIALGSNVFGQSTGTTPAPGATHSYTVNADDDHGSTYEWSIWQSDFTTSAVTSGEASFVGGINTSNSISITWDADEATEGEIFYVRVKETNSGCVNEKVLKVTITASQFYLTLSGATSSCYDGDPQVTIDSGDGEPRYNHGTSTITYTVTPEGLSDASNGYSFDFSNVLSKFDPAAVSIASGDASISSGLVEVNDESAVTIQVVVTSTLLDNSDIDGTGADFISTNQISNGLTGNGVSDNGDGVYEIITTVSRPHTTIIETN